MKSNIDKILKSKVLEASGCTEPIAVAYAVACAARLVDEKPIGVKVILSANVIKNAMIVCLPGTEGKSGLALAAAMGALYGDDKKELNVISGFTRKQVSECELFAAEKVKVQPADVSLPLYIEAVINFESGKTSRVIIENGHTNIVLKEIDGTPIMVKRSQDVKSLPVDFDLEDIYSYVDDGDGDMEFVDKIVAVNSRMSDEGLKNDYGLRTGKAISERDKAYMLMEKLSVILQYTTAAVDARMAGADLPVMSNSGSGNQGLIATVPVIAAANAFGLSLEMKRKCVLMSSLVTIYVKSMHDVLSAYCGAAIASTGVAAALTYMMGGDKEQIRMSIQNSLGNSFGVLCDGAKETCSFKVANCTFSAVYSAFLALKGSSPKVREGIICDNAEATLMNIAHLGKKTSKILDETLMEIMLKDI